MMMAGKNQAALVVCAQTKVIFPFNSLNVTQVEVQETLKSLNVGKAAGPDSISNRLLKELAVPLSLPLCNLVNYSLHTGQVPSSWKEANITPIHKKDDPSEVSNTIVLYCY